MKQQILYSSFGLLLVITSAFSATTKGERTYDIACKACHAPTVSKSVNAPAVHDVAAWKVRYQAAEQVAKQQPQRFKNADAVLLYSVKIGKGMMHHGGLCAESREVKKDCSNEAMISAIKYMMQPK